MLHQQCCAWAPQGKAAQRWERTRSAAPAGNAQCQRGKLVHRCLLTRGKTASRSRKTNCSKLMNITNSCAGLPNTTAVFVFGILKGLGLLLVWEAYLGQQSRQKFPALRAQARTGESFLLLPRDTDKLMVYRRP